MRLAALNTHAVGLLVGLVVAGAEAGGSLAPRAAHGAPSDAGADAHAAAASQRPDLVPALTDVAFYEGSVVPVDALAFFSAVVMDAGRAPVESVGALAHAGTRPLARLSMTAGSRADDLATRARRLAAAGYEGALLELVPAPGSSMVTTPHEVADAVAALRTVWPRGILLLAAEPRLAVGAAPQLAGIVVRGSVDRAAELVAFARDQLAAGRAGPVPIIDIETVAPHARTEARRLAERIGRAGLIPWVTIGGPDGLGVGTIEPMPRRVLVVQDSAEEPNLAASVAHRLIALPSSTSVTRSITPTPAPACPRETWRRATPGSYTWFTDDNLPAGDRYETWFRARLDEGLKVAILDHLGFAPSAALLGRLGLVAPTATAEPPLHVAHADDWVGFEAAPTAPPAIGRAGTRPDWCDTWRLPTTTGTG